MATKVAGDRKEIDSVISTSRPRTRQRRHSEGTATKELLISEVSHPPERILDKVFRYREGPCKKHLVTEK